MLRAFAPFVLVGACAPPPEAPVELGALSRYLFQHFDDVETTADGLLNLEDLLLAAEVEPTTPVDDRVWTLPAMDIHDVSLLPKRPPRDPAGVLGLGSAFVSAWSASCHAQVHVAEDQLPVEPNAVTYVRRFPFDDDPSCFPERRCEQVHAVSEVTRSNIVLTLDFELHKTYRWTDVTDTDGAVRAAIVARSWSEESFEGRGGTLWQSYATDIWLPRPDGGTWRYQAHWSETEINGLGDTSDIQLNLNRKATEEAMVATESVLADRCGARP